MRCLDVRMELQAYVDGESSLEQAGLLEQHLAACEACREELGRLQIVAAALESWPLVAEPADLTARVMARVRLCPAVALPRFRLHWDDLAISAAGAMLFFTVMLTWRYLSTSGSAQLYWAQIYLWLEMLQLKALLLGGSGAVAAAQWLIWLMLAALVTLAMGYFAAGEQGRSEFVSSQ
ncbi:MAG: hypothetical protein CVU38_15840 [Chloroflexi bacterium HGW-Chloroflexi-1]|nr:MAG: hypothetical protein CVU38_15840 [Chloroflexi bacterium HGW-Chloroflexi-1]